jgi:hypothetical protein
MADLLECLIQIKALGEAPGLAALAPSAGDSTEGARTGVSGLWRSMAEAERRYATALGGVTTAGKAASDATGGRQASHREAFIAQRRANLVLLQHCTGAQLAGFVEWPGRPSTTVADLVAIMLAHDTERLAVLRRYLIPNSPSAR